ncbi:MAG: hypothetical protein H0U84_04965 [Thermoleophilaceae bacterium]|nr:hypothetical protein [Thermoleophilaceae bacterium]
MDVPLRRGKFLLVTVAVVALAVCASVAYAATIQCTGGDCRGTDNDDEIRGTGDLDRIYAGSGNDVVRARADEDGVLGGPGADTINGGRDGDHLFGGSGPDVVRGGDGWDGIFGNEGNDRLYPGRRNEPALEQLPDDSYGGDGNDRIYAADGTPGDSVHGGAGYDICWVDPHWDAWQGCEVVHESGI